VLLTIHDCFASVKFEVPFGNQWLDGRLASS